MFSRIPNLRSYDFFLIFFKKKQGRILLLRSKNVSGERSNFYFLDCSPRRCLIFPYKNGRFVDSELVKSCHEQVKNCYNYSVLSIKRTGSLNYFEGFFPPCTLNLPCSFNNFSKFYHPDCLIDPVG